MKAVKTSVAIQKWEERDELGFFKVVKLFLQNYNGHYTLVKTQNYTMQRANLI